MEPEPIAPTYVKVRTTIYHNGETTRYRCGIIPEYMLDEDIMDERAAYGNQRGVQSVEDAGKTVVAVFENGVVRITHYR